MFNWTPSYTDAGVHSFTIVATNDGDGTGKDASTSRTFTIDVANVNRAPSVATILNQTLAAGATLSLPIVATDPDNDPMTLSVVGLPSFAKFVTDGNGAGHFAFAPTDDDRGNYTITVKVADDGDGAGPGASLSSSRSFVLTVTAPNVPPHFVATGDKVLLIGAPSRFTLQANDADQGPLTFSLDGLPPGATATAGPGYGQETISWTPTAADAGTYRIVAHVTDDGNGVPAQALSDQMSFSLNVRANDAAPAFPTRGVLTVAQEATLSADVSAVDPDGDALTYSTTGLPPGAAVDPVTGKLTWAVGAARRGRMTA